MARGSAETKGRLLLTEARLVVSCVDGDLITASCRGDSGEVYTLGHDPQRGRWYCTCQEMKGRCSHLVALQLVTIRQRGEGHEQRRAG